MSGAPFKQGDRVEVQIGGVGKWRAGTVRYRRMAPPDYREVAAYSVRLDEKLSRPGYDGTLVKPADVRAIVVG